MKYFQFILAFILTNGIAQGQKNDSEANFLPGESLTYEIQYSWLGFWTSAGEVTFSVDTTTWMQQQCYHFKGEGGTYSHYNWFYKVDDTYEAYSDKKTLQPYRSMRDVNEGSSYFYHDCIFDYPRNQAYLVRKEPDKPVVVDTVAIPDSTFDVLSIIYHTRQIDFSSVKVNDTIPTTIILDKTIYPTSIRYLGTENLESEKYGIIKCHKFKPRLIKGTIFKGGEGMTVWVTADENQIAVYIESEILVGTIQAELIKHSGLKYPFPKKD